MMSCQLGDDNEIVLDKARAVILSNLERRCHGWTSSFTSATIGSPPCRKVARTISGMLNDPDERLAYYRRVLAVAEHDATPMECPLPFECWEPCA